MFTCTLLRSIYVRLVFTVFCVIVLTSAAMAGVVVNSPANGATVSSPAHVVASASSTRPISAMRIYLDGRSAYTVGGGTLNTHVSLSPGWHSLVVQAWDTSGAVFKQVRSVNVVGTSAPSGGSTAPGGAIVIATSTAWADGIHVSGVQATAEQARRRRIMLSTTYRRHPSMVLLRSL